MFLSSFNRKSKEGTDLPKTIKELTRESHKIILGQVIRIKELDNYSLCWSCYQED